MTRRSRAQDFRKSTQEGPRRAMCVADDGDEHEQQLRASRCLDAARASVVPAQAEVETQSP
jgi:hypothetical protein